MSRATAFARRLGGRLARTIVGPKARPALAMARRTGVLRIRREMASPRRARLSLAAYRAYASGDTQRAVTAIDRVLARDPDNAIALLFRAQLASERGEIVAEAEALQRLVLLRRSPRLARRERIARGRQLDSDVAWMPAGPEAERLIPSSNRVIMHLLKNAMPERQSGYTIRSRALLAAQKQAGLEPFAVIAPGFPEMASGDDPAVVVYDGIVQHRLEPGVASRDMALDEQLTRTVDRAAPIVRRERPALIHAASGWRGYDLAVPALVLGRTYGLPVVYEVRGFFEEVAMAGRDADARAQLSGRRHERELQVMLAADHVVTIADVMRDEIIQRGVSASQVSVIPNAVDIDAFKPTAPSPGMLDRLGLGGRPVVGYITSLDHPREGVDLLIEAMAILLGEGRSVGCLIVGDGERRPSLEKQARQAGIGDAVVFTGAVPHAEVSRYYALLDIFVVPRRDDRAARFTTPLKPLEAMAMARPVVVSDLPALRELIGNEERGVAFRTGDARSLATTLAELLDHPERSAALAASGRAWVERERTWRANGERYRSMYEAILDARPPTENAQPETARA